MKRKLIVNQNSKNSLFLLSSPGLQDEVFPQYLHVRYVGVLQTSPRGPRRPMVLVKKAAGVRDLHWASLGPGLLSQLPTQLGPLPLLGVESVEPDLTQDHQVNSHLTIDHKTFVFQCFGFF